jgi:hypothetical protein
MFKKTLISLAVASSVGLTGCLSGGDEGANANPTPTYTDSSVDGKTWPLFNPATREFPLPNDLLFSGTKDGTFELADSRPPVTTALDKLSGASTVAPQVIQTNGQLDESTVITGETVFLTEVVYASGDPVQALASGEPPAPAAAAPQGYEPPKVRAEVIELDGNSAIRILPLEPLKPNTRYVVAVTTGVKDVNGESIIPEPGQLAYGTLTKTDEEAPLLNEDLAPVRTLINSFWEPITAAATGGAVTEANIAITYSFTTSNDEKVLPYIAEPAAWAEDSLTSFIRGKAVSGAPESADSYAELAPLAQAAVQEFTVGQLELSGPIGTALSNNCGSFTGVNAIKCTAVGLATNLISSPSRSASDFDFSTATQQPVGLVSAVANSVYEAADNALNNAAPDVLLIQGTLSLPYYLGQAKETVLSNSWVADDVLAGTINSALGGLLELPQGATSEREAVSTVVNWRFPFPKKQADVDVPALVIYPNQGTTKGVVIYQHGITTDRSTALTFGTALAALGYTVVAIDHPLHGIAPFTDEEQLALAVKLLTAAGLDKATAESLAPALVAGRADFDAALAGTPLDAAFDGNARTSLVNTVENAGSTVPGLAPMPMNERHFGLYSPQPGSVASINYETGVGDSGSMYINLLNLTNGRDNLRESVISKLNLRGSLANLDLSGFGGANLAGAEVFFVGHSLGTISGATLVASANGNQIGAPFADPSGNDISAVSMLTPGGGIVRLLENSPAFAPRILFGLANNEDSPLTQGDASLETYFNVFQATIDTADPINFVNELETSTPEYYQAVVEKDLVIPNAADQELWGIPALKATLPYEFRPGMTAMVDINSFNAPLAGSYPLSLIYGDAPSGLEDPRFELFELADYLVDGEIPRDEDGNPVLSHSTPVSAQPSAAFLNMVLMTDGTFTP